MMANMNILVVALGLFVAVACRPNEMEFKNVVVVPPNCPEGQAWVNEQCRDVWFRFSSVYKEMTDAGQYGGNLDNQNVVVVPPNCLPGQVLVNGVCRDVWRNFHAPQNVIIVPQNCPPGQVFVNGACRVVWFKNPEYIQQEAV